MIACFLMEQIGIAVERARLTHLWGEPFGLAAADGSLKVISDEAARCGIQVGQSLTGARALCDRLAILPYDTPSYEVAAQCVWDLLAIESSVVEPVSPEICFVELTGLQIIERARELAALIAPRVRIPVRVGLAATKIAARQAALQNEDFVTVPIGAEAAFLASMPIALLTQIDFKTRQRLARLGLSTLGDVLKLPPRELSRQFREIGLLLRRLALGQDGDRVRPLWPPRRIEHTLPFEDEVADSATLSEALRRCAAALAGRLAESREYCRTLALLVSLADGSRMEETEKLALPADAGPALHRAALRLLKRLPLDKPLLSVGLRASDLGAGSGVQLTLIDDNDTAQGLPHERRRRLEAAIAFVRKRYGAGAIVTAAMLRQARRIGLWTYPLGHLLDEPVQVATDARGRPVRYWRRGRMRSVASIQNCWRETEWFWGSLAEKAVYRVETDPSGLSELHRLGVNWRICALAD